MQSDQFNPQATLPTGEPPMGPFSQNAEPIFPDPVNPQPTSHPVNEAPSQTRSAKKPLGAAGLSALLLTAVVLGGTVSGVSVYQLMEARRPVIYSESVTAQLNREPQTTQVQHQDAGYTPRQIADKASAAVVAINTTSLRQGLFGQVGAVEGAGSGVLISADGYIVTNNHVVARSNEITVNLANGEMKQARVIGQDPATDLAVIKIEGEQLPYLDMGDSTQVHAGDQVVAIGNPLGELEGSVTVGYISATNRTVSVKEEDGSIQTMFGLFQTDAAINRGNSGGALINRSGELIGINTVKTAAPGVEGLGFAIPTQTVKPIVSDLIQFGQIQDRPSLGISGLSIRPELAKEFDYPQGIYVREVLEGGPAAQAGIHKGDILTALNGHKVRTISDINGIKAQLKAGQEITLSIYRAGETHEVKLTLGKETPSKSEN